MSHHKEPPQTIYVNTKPALSVPRGRSRSRTPQTLSRSRTPQTRKRSKQSKCSKTPMPRPRERSVPRKLGPRDIGRISYKGLKYVDKNDNHFLDEKVHRRSRASQYSKKKPSNRNRRWQKGYVFLDETYGPSTDKGLKAIKWPSDFKMDQNEYWFDSPKVEMDTDLRKLIEVLPAEQKSTLHRMPLPKDDDTKIQFLKELRKMVMSEVKRLHIEDKELTELADEIEEDFNRDLDEALNEVLANVSDGMDDSKKCESLHDQNPSTMTLDVDIEKAIDGIIDQDQDIKDAELLEHKYKKMLKRRNNKMGLFQRKLLTMRTINELTDLINNMERIKEMKIQNE